MGVTVETHASLAEAARAVEAGATLIAGGTIVMRRVNAGDQRLTRIVRVADPAFARISGGGGTISIGAGATMAAIAAHRDLDFLAPVARQLGGPALRNMATIGGNLFARAPYGDMAVALLALGARVTGTSGARPVEDLLRARDRAGLVFAIEVPRPRPGEFAWAKITRVHPYGSPVLTIAVHAPREGGRLRGVRVAFGGMGPGPVRATGAERALEGQPLDAATIARAAQAAAEGLEPVDDAVASAWYRREVAGVHLRRVLEGMS
ncbi:MAG: oxidoreductase [Paracoccaceae bacterium]|nr:MAG: oxidoreductase [Paracoccaceae bacterium]